MLIVTAKMPKRKLALGVAVAALLCCCTVALNFGQAVVQEVSATTVPNPKGLKSNEDRIEYLSSFGWQVSPEPIATQELLIPKEMDESYDGYLALQQQQGFSLDRYAGKRVKRYTYEVTNYPGQHDGVQVNLLIYKHTAVGGEVLSTNLDGFLHGLEMP